MATYNTSDFLNSVRQRGAIPTSTNSNNVNSTTNLLALGTEELLINLFPMIMSAREELYVAPPKDYAITANQAEYVIPTRASGVALRGVYIVSGTAIRKLPELDINNLTYTSTGTPEGYYLRHNVVTLYPTPGGTDGTTLRLRYFLRPSRLAATSDCAQITAIDTVSNTITVAAVPGTMTTSTALDLVAATAPYQCRAIDYTPTGTSSTTITFSTLPSDLAVGDWVALADYTPIPQVPPEFQAVLAHMTMAAALEAQGDNDGAARARKRLDDPDTGLKSNALKLITPRNQGAAHKIIAPRWSR